MCYLLGSADQDSGKEAQSHPELVNKRLVVRDVSEKENCAVTPVTKFNTLFKLAVVSDGGKNTENGSPVPRIHKVFQDQLQNLGNYKNRSGLRYFIY